jgi:predicted glycoside hydrolase/deacetylase ChbG (UPF0249 family)
VPPRLILNADDFGLTPGINRAVAELYQAGVLTSATLMATGPAFADAVAVARSNPGLGVGCHLVFVGGIPISHPESIPSLLGADGKTFRPSVVDFAQAVLRRTIRASDLARETQAQIQKLQRAGVDVTHVDTHKHTHLFPFVAQTVQHIAQRCGVEAMRAPFEPEWSAALAPGATLLRRAQLRLLRRFEPAFRRLTRSAAERGFIPSGTLGIAATGCLNQLTLRAMLRQFLTEHDGGNSFELCCHPGYNDDALATQQTRLRDSRELEMRALLAVVPEIKEHRLAPEFIHYGDLGVAGLQRASGQFAPYTGFEKVL